ncbi:TPA: tRNA (uridine(34)/cytosine(34)/5-carboxymethylaminomethyluridine(34)-2'-O)-methyltransferase TrmL, partial [Listeria monocytogenes]
QQNFGALLQEPNYDRKIFQD